MKNICFYWLFWILILISPFMALADDRSVSDLFLGQVKTYPQEKIYVQTDKPYYIAGENVWFRAFLADNMSLLPDTTSRYIYAELINTNDSLVARVKIRPETEHITVISLYTRSLRREITRCGSTHDTWKI